MHTIHTRSNTVSTESYIYTFNTIFYRCVETPKNVTILIQDELAEKMRKFPEVNWSEVCRKAIDNYIKEREGVPPKVEQGLTFDDFLKECGVTPTLWKGFSSRMKDTLRDRDYPQWYYHKKQEILPQEKKLKSRT